MPENEEREVRYDRTKSRLEAPYGEGTGSDKGDECEYLTHRIGTLEDDIYAEKLRSAGLEASLRELLADCQLAVGTWNEEMRSGEQFLVLMGAIISSLEVRNAGARFSGRLRS